MRDHGAVGRDRAEDRSKESLPAAPGVAERPIRGQSVIWPTPLRWWLHNGHVWRESVPWWEEDIRSREGPEGLVGADLDLYLRQMEEGRNQ